MKSIKNKFNKHEIQIAVINVDQQQHLIDFVIEFGKSGYSLPPEPSTKIRNFYSDFNSQMFGITQRLLNEIAWPTI